MKPNMSPKFKLLFGGLMIVALPHSAHAGAIILTEQAMDQITAAGEVSIVPVPLMEPRQPDAPGTALQPPHTAVPPAHPQTVLNIIRKPAIIVGKVVSNVRPGPLVGQQPGPIVGQQPGPLVGQQTAVNNLVTATPMVNLSDPVVVPVVVNEIPISENTIPVVEDVPPADPTAGGTVPPTDHSPASQNVVSSLKVAPEGGAIETRVELNGPSFSATAGAAASGPGALVVFTRAGGSSH